MKEYHILNLGAGVQSTTVYLMFCEGILRPKLDYAIFADTQAEPEDVYHHLEWMKSLNGPPILVVTAGSLADHLKQNQNSTAGHFISIPAFVRTATGTGAVRRQCSSEYKIKVIDRCIRRDILAVKPKHRIPKDVIVHQYFGISLDEATRTIGIRQRSPQNRVIHFPLIDLFKTRSLCISWLRDRVPHPVPRSACVFCPYHNDAEWLRIKENPRDWKLAIEVDGAIRDGAIKLKHKQYVHSSCVPLEQVQFNTKPSIRDLQMPFNFRQECMGVCGV